MTTAPTGDALRGIARELRARIADSAATIEQQRRVPAELVAEMARAGLFRMLVPRDAGGVEAEPRTMLDVLEEIACGDGSAGWAVMIGATTGVIAAYLPASATNEIFTASPEGVTGGVFHPRGHATVVDGGYRVSGRWPLASGCQHCAWLLGGCLVVEDGKPRLRDGGAPEARMMIFPARDVQIIDTWNVSGLRGTGSHDIAVADLFVPAERSVWFSTDPVRRGGALYAFPVFGLLALGIAAVALGIARGAIDDVLELAGAKVPTGSRRPLAERSATQATVAQATALVAASRAHLHATVDAVWRTASSGGAVSLEQRARLRLAATQTVRDAAKAVDLAYECGGATSIYEDSALQRRFRDVHVATQHVLVAPATYELAGRVLLGLPADTERL
ncbi:acyl-CoA dehydrogenase family protein [Candidatus Binatia bacterium]|nr:acyl-CoA dehydrogenase family protein [Candidatus Binatia bacterium]